MISLRHSGCTVQRLSQVRSWWPPQLIALHRNRACHLSRVLAHRLRTQGRAGGQARNTVRLIMASPEPAIASQSRPHFSCSRVYPLATVSRPAAVRAWPQCLRRQARPGQWAAQLLHGSAANHIYWLAVAARFEATICEAAAPPIR
jgi:hypothetical protein